MKKLFVVADVHSFYNEMIDALAEKGFDKNDPDHVFVSLGDLFDRGPDPFKCLVFVDSIPAERKILIRGNHEDLLEECLAREDFLMHDAHNGTMDTVLKFARVRDFEEFEAAPKRFFEEVRTDERLVRYLAEVRDYAEMGEYLFVHGWVPARKNAPSHDWRLGNWKEARWFNGMEKWRQGARPQGKTVLCGHYHTSWGHFVLEKKGSEFGENADFSPFMQPGIIALDACTAYSGRVNCVLLETD